MDETGDFVLGQEPISHHIRPRAQAGSGIVTNSWRFPTTSEIEQVTDNHDRAVDCSGRVSVLAHLVNELCKRGRSYFIERKMTELRKNMDSQDCFVRHPARFV